MWSLTVNEKVVMWDINSWAHVRTTIITKMECTGFHTQPAMQTFKHKYTKSRAFGRTYHRRYLERATETWLNITSIVNLHFALFHLHVGPRWIGNDKNARFSSSR
jgi:hypothetical protein